MPSTTPDREQRIRERAYYLWLAAGCPHGAARLHWRQAEAIEDMATREILGRAMADRLRAGLCVDALVMAIRRCEPPRGLIHHSDRGVRGGFKWSSQHRGGGWCDGGEKAFGSGAAG